MVWYFLGRLPGSPHWRPSILERIGAFWISSVLIRWKVRKLQMVWDFLGRIPRPPRCCPSILERIGALWKSSIAPNGLIFIGQAPRAPPHVHTKSQVNSTLLGWDMAIFVMCNIELSTRGQQGEMYFHGNISTMSLTSPSMCTPNLKSIALS